MEVPAPTHFLHLKLPRSLTFHSTKSSSESIQSIKRTISSDKVFKLKSLDTGEEIDLRDENESSFIPKLARMLTLGHGYALHLESYFETRRQADHKLWEAAERGDLEGCQHALTIAQTNSKGLNDWTALHLAAHMGHISVVLMLLHPSFGTDVNSLTSLHRTALHLATISNFTDIMECLIAHGTDVNAQDKEGWTALHHAANSGYVEAIKLLSKAGVDEYIADEQGKIAYDVAKNAEVANLMTPSPARYNRTLFNGVLMHNSREDKVTTLLRLTTEPKKDAKVTEAMDISPSSLPTEESKHRFSPTDFHVVAHLGRGSFGEVYYCKLGSEELALKVLNKSQVLAKTVLRYTKTEREVLALVHHPFIIELKMAFQTADKLVLALEYCPGGDLGYHLSREKRFPEERARVYLSEILLALEELHSNHIIYRDLKPDNVVLDVDGHAKLTDFGLAKIVKNDQAKSFCGSVAYLAPELIKRQPYTLAVDWYLLGVLLYEMLVGIPPFFSCNRDLLFENIQKAKLKFPKFVSEPAQSLISRLMDRDPKTRLGANGAEEVKQHPFFSSIDWRAAFNRRLKPTPVQRIPRKQETLPPDTVFGSLSKADTNIVEDWAFP